MFNTIGMLPIPLRFNCGYARVAVKELLSTEQTGRTIDKPKRAQEFRELFDIPTFGIPDGYFTEKKGKSYGSLFDRHCTRVLSGFAM